MDGSIGVESEYGKGSCFYINLPQKVLGEKSCGERYGLVFDRALENESDSSLKNIPISLLNSPELAFLFTEKLEAVQFAAPRAKILVVDDNDVNLQVAEGLLKKYGISPELCTSGFKALELLEKNQYDIIFMDHQMPEMDGMETARKIRASEKVKNQNTIIAMSANAVNGVEEMFLSNGFDGFLPKPVQGTDFARCLGKWLDPSLLEKVSESTEEKCEIPDDFPTLDAERVDLKSGLENTGGFENWIRTVKTFSSSIDRNADLIESLLKKNDVKNYTIQVHALKSSARIIGAKNLSKQAEFLEALGRQILESREKISALMSEIEAKTLVMLELYRSYGEILSEVTKYGEKSELEKSEISRDELELILKDIVESCRRNSLDKLEIAVDKLKSRKLPPDFESKMPTLLRFVDEIEFEAIIGLVENGG